MTSAICHCFSSQVPVFPAYFFFFKQKSLCTQTYLKLRILLPQLSDCRFQLLLLRVHFYTQEGLRPNFFASYTRTVSSKSHACATWPQAGSSLPFTRKRRVLRAGFRSDIVVPEDCDQQTVFTWCQAKSESGSICLKKKQFSASFPEQFSFQKFVLCLLSRCHWPAGTSLSLGGHDNIWNSFSCPSVFFRQGLSNDACL